MDNKIWGGGVVSLWRRLYMRIVTSMEAMLRLALYMYWLEGGKLAAMLPHTAILHMLCTCAVSLGKWLNRVSGPWVSNQLQWHSINEQAWEFQISCIYFTWGQTTSFLYDRIIFSLMNFLRICKRIMCAGDGGQTSWESSLKDCNPVLMQPPKHVIQR